MKLRQVTLLALVALSLGACKKRTPEVAPTPDQTSTPGAVTSDYDRAAADAAEAERRAREAREIARIRESLTEMIFFEYDSEQLTHESQDRLRAKAAILRANPGIRLRIEGHADERGSTEYNLALGQRRAESVRTFLAGFGITGDRLGTISYGKERPLVEGSGEAAWARNRRAEFMITAGEVVHIPSEVR